MGGVPKDNFFMAGLIALVNIKNHKSKQIRRMKQKWEPKLPDHCAAWAARAASLALTVLTHPWRTSFGTSAGTRL